MPVGITFTSALLAVHIVFPILGIQVSEELTTLLYGGFGWSISESKNWFFHSRSKKKDQD